jgi:hypothetical protein
MSNDALTYLIAACVGVFSLALWAAFVLVPAWSAYQRWWERIVATLLSVYVLAAFVLVGGGIGALLLFYYDEL